MRKFLSIVSLLFSISIYATCLNSNWTVDDDIKELDIYRVFDNTEQEFKSKVAELECVVDWKKAYKTDSYFGVIVCN